MTEAHDTEAILGTEDEDGLYSELKTEHDVNGLSARFRAGQASYFGEDVAEYTSGRTLKNLAAMVAIVRGEGAEQAFAYAGRMNKEELVTELRNALDEAGFTDFEMGVSSVGRELPLIIAILQDTHGVGISQALGAHSDLIDYEYE